MEIKGKVLEISDVMEISSTFKKRELILEYIENPTYPEFLKFEVTQEKTGLFDGIAIGSQVEVSFNLRGRPWTDKNGKTAYFNSLIAWKIKTVEAAKPENNAPVNQAAFEIPSGAEMENDLPF